MRTRVFSPSWVNLAYFRGPYTAPRTTMCFKRVNGNTNKKRSVARCGQHPDMAPVDLAPGRVQHSEASTQVP
ncbi:TPA_asm: hypothetical protein GB005_06565 [Salmonella enterica subsp. enterica]|uniref:Uncharacterized protein n=1 Tax=Salmonella enterica I TaxID=59201 RepID=A0A6Y2RPP4_SALET|nr:hypothetical protein [Salmonella enterica subsp. enterica]